MKPEHGSKREIPRESWLPQRSPGPAPGHLSVPVLPSRRRTGMPEGRAARTPEGAGAPSSQAPTSLDYSEPWGRRDGESLNCREGNGQMRSGEAGRKAAEAELGRGVRGPTCSGRNEGEEGKSSANFGSLGSLDLTPSCQSSSHRPGLP